MCVCIDPTFKWNYYLFVCIFVSGLFVVVFVCIFSKYNISYIKISKFSRGWRGKCFKIVFFFFCLLCHLKMICGGGWRDECIYSVQISVRIGIAFSSSSMLRSLRCFTKVSDVRNNVISVCTFSTISFVIESALR